MKIRPPKFMRRILETGKTLFYKAREKVKQSLRLQLIFTFVLCIIGTWLIYGIADSLFSDRDSQISYTQGMTDIDDRARDLSERLSSVYSEAYPDEPQVLHSVYDQVTIQETIQNETSYGETVKVLLVDLDGKVLFRSSNASETQVDLHSIIRNAMDTRIQGEINGGDEFNSFYPVDLKDVQAYVVLSGVPHPILVETYHGSPFLASIAALSFFIFAFYYLTKKKMAYIEELAQGLFEISKGNLDFRVARKSEDELGSLASNINNMAQELKSRIEEERRAEKTKNELITNVSHDLRTPLTSIMGYLRLLKDKKYESGDQVDNYIEIAYGKSEKLKSLIEDLFEYTKLANYGDMLHKEKVCLNELLEQLTDELVPVAEENKITMTKEFAPERIMVIADPDKIVRVFENLYVNAIRYSYKPGEITTRMYRNNGKVTVSIKNLGDAIDQETLTRLFERFYRVDQSRSSVEGGSGLGLAIAKNIIELHGGAVWAECNGNEITFFVQLGISMV